jgi:hypothetical protein
MDEVTHFVAISYGTRNTSNMMMAAVVVIGFIVFCVIIMNNTRQKIFPYTPAKYLDLTNAMNNSLDAVLDVAVGSIVDASYNNAYQHNLTTFNDYKEKNASKIMNIFTNLYADEKSNTETYNTLNNVLTSMGNVTKNLATLQNTNIKTLETLYAGYQTKIQDFVTKLIGMLTTINTQIKTLSVSDQYKPLINPLSKIFTSIRNTLVTNAKVINQIKPNIFDSSKLPTLNSDIIIPSVTNTAPDIFRKSGF